MPQRRLRIERWLLTFAVSVPLGVTSRVNAEQAIVLGFTQPNVTVDVAFSQPGRVKSLHVVEGQRVAEGELLATLDEGVLPLTQQIAEVRAEDNSAIDAAQAKLAALEKRVEELQRLRQSGGASPEEVRRVSTERDVSRSELQQAQAEQQVQGLEVKRLEMERELRRLKAPFEGFVTEIEKRPGEYVAVTEPQVLQMVQLNPLKIRFALPVQAAGALASGDKVTIQLALDGRDVNATVRRVSRVVDPQSGTALVELELANEQMKYRAGLKCRWTLSPMAGQQSPPASP